MLMYLCGISEASVSMFGIIHQIMHGLFVMCLGSAFVLCSVWSSLCVPTGDDICSTVGVSVIPICFTLKIISQFAQPRVPKVSVYC